MASSPTTRKTWICPSRSASTGWWSARDQERLEAYLALRRQGFHPRRDLTPFFGVLGYTQQRIHTGYDAFHHLFPPET